MAVGMAEPEIIKDIEYSRPDGYPLLLDLYLPEEAKNSAVPVVVWAHGGAGKMAARKIPRRVGWRKKAMRW